MSSNSYLIKLKPLGNFYFGGESSFREAVVKDESDEVVREEVDDKGDEDKDTAVLSYIVKSNYFPQQTALLGMLRFLLLRNAGDEIFKDNKIVKGANTEVADLIGASSFKLGDGDCSFGKIEEIGTCFICKGKDMLLPMPMDYELNVDFNGAIQAIYHLQKVSLPSVTYKFGKSKRKQFSAKDGVCESFILADNVINYSDIFVKDRRIGIDRNITTGKVEKNALYKQEFYRLKDGYQFAFTAQLKEGINYSDYNGMVVELGGDNSKFSITFEQPRVDAKYNECNKIEVAQGAYKAVLLSDALIEGEDAELFCFSISANTPMRFMQTTIKDTNYSKIDKSGRQSLYKKGSVFYFNSEPERSAFIEAVNRKKNFIKIGYNNIQKID